MKRLLPFLVVPLLAGCPFDFGGSKVKDAEAIGYACRVSVKAPETCMKENEAHSPTAILEGWKAADKDIKDKKIDASFGNKPAGAATEQKEEPKPEAEGEQKKAEEQPAGEKEHGKGH